MKLPKLTLFVKILLTVLITFSLMASLSAVSEYRTAKRDMHESDKEVFLKIAVALSKETTTALNYGRKITQHIAYRTTIRDLVAKNNTDKTLKASVLRTLDNYNAGGSFAVFFLLNTDGDCILSTDESFVGNNFKFRNYFTQSMKGEMGADAAVGVISRKMGYYFSAPVYSNDNSTLIGVAVTKMEQSEIHSILNSGDFGFNTNVMLTNDNGVILHSSEAERVFWSLAPLSEAKMEIERKTRFIDREIQSLTYDRAASEIEHYINPVIYDFYDNEDRAEEMVSVVKVGDYPYFIVTETQSKALVKHITDQVLPIIILTVLGILVGMVVVGLIIKRILSPISIIRDYVLKVANGEKGVKLAIKTGDELEEISEGIKKIVNR